MDDDAFEWFALPVAALTLYDDPYRSLGDEGCDIEGLRAEVLRDGGIRNPIAVGKSLAEVTERDNHSAYSFNGNHRLAVARELGFPEMLCEHSWADDAEPLTRAEIEALGGRVLPGPSLDSQSAGPGPL